MIGFGLILIDSCNLGTHALVAGYSLGVGRVEVGRVWRLAFWVVSFLAGNGATRAGCSSSSSDSAGRRLSPMFCLHVGARPWHGCVWMPMAMDISAEQIWQILICLRIG